MFLKGDIYIIIFKIFIIFIIFIFNLINSEKRNLPEFKNVHNNDTFNFKETNLTKSYLFEKINKYIKICRNGILINKISNNKNYKTKISAIIPVYNASKTIKPAVRSIQNQDMSELEIILVDDVSPDNSVEIINQLILEDKRIRLIKNKKNKGILYSRSIGALNAKGKYIMALDNDDLFLFGIFNKCYKEAKKNNFDII